MSEYNARELMEQLNDTWVSDARDGVMIDALGRAFAALRAVLGAHQECHCHRSPHEPHCLCHDAWPCVTVRAIADALREAP
jgi:hypothetical protein